MDEMEKRLFDFYLDGQGPEAGPWNRSTHCCYVEYWIRDFLTKQVEPFSGIEVCNVGIGAGDWDNFLCDWLRDTGRLTSVDIDKPICDLFAYRQQREGHPSPSTVVCADIMADTLPAASFDIVTVIGSTVGESGAYERCLTSCWCLVREGGHLMYMDFPKRPPGQFEALAASLGAHIERRDDSRIAAAYAFWVKKPPEAP